MSGCGNWPARDRPALSEIGIADLQRHARWFAEVARRTAVLMAHWLRVGFCAWVMKTDNLSILGSPSTTALWLA